MLLSNSRIDKSKNVKFYEQDILLDDHVYTGNVQVTINLEYISPGIGIALVKNEGVSLKEDGETYLFRIGHSDYSIVRRTGVKTEIIVNGAVENIRPYKENLKLMIRKINNRVYFYVNNKLLSNKYLPTSLDNFMIGIYSSAGNIVNSISIASEIPEGWVVNMNNTNGGYIKFSSNKFTISNCLDKAEVEQMKIDLKANTESKQRYYLKYEVEDESDIEVYVFKSDDIRYVDKDKNILEKDNSFILKHDQQVNIKFVGTKGTVKNIQITDSKDDFYIGTDYEMSEVTESYIKIKTDELSKIEWSGTIYNTPDYDLTNPGMERFGIVRDAENIYYPQKCKVEMGNEYEYAIELNQAENKGTLTKRGGVFYTAELKIIDSVTLFENVDAIIKKLVLYKKDGTVINVILENTKKQYVPAAIKSPIIVTTEDGEPLDLSSSYRVIDDNYAFTNVEREIFEPSNRIMLTNVASTKLDSLVVYGVLHESNTDSSKIMHSHKENIRDISPYCDNFEVLRESDLYNVNKSTGVIIISDKNDGFIKSKYKEIIIDYLKKDSYAINYKHELSSYEVDISTESNTKMYYDGAAASNDIVDIQEYKLLNNMTLENNSYIVIKGGN